MNAYIFLLKAFTPFPESFLRKMVPYDLGSLHLLSLVGVLSLGLIILFRWIQKPMGAVYLLAASLPVLEGSLWGVWQYDKALIRITEGGSFVARTPEDLLDDGVFTIHYALIFSALLYFGIVFLYAMDFVIGRLGEKPSVPFQES